MKKNPTIVDVAKLAGVSRTTVSNVLNGNNKFNEETRDRILKVIEEIGYQPNLSARTLVGKKAKMLGIVLPEYASDLDVSTFYDKIMNGINSQIIKRSDYGILLTLSNSIDDIKKWIATRNIDGIILVGEYDHSFIEKLSKVNVPVVMIDNYNKKMENISYINSDDEKGAYLATSHLINNGYKNIGIVTIDENSSPLIRKRVNGYRRALKEKGYSENIVPIDNTTFENGKSIAKVVIENGFDALFVVSDETAIGVLNGLLRNGIKIPDEIGLVGFDNIPVSWQVLPSLTTIDQNIFEKGATAVKVLIEKIETKESEKLQRVVLPVSLIERETTK